MSETIVIIGANLAGGSAAATLREEGFDGDVILVGDEPEPPYERPPLSKEYLRGEMTFEKTLVRPRAFYDENRIEALFGVRATGIDSAARVVELEGGRRLRFGKVLIATGGRNRRPPIPGLDLEGVHDLRTLADANAIRAEIAAGRRAVVVGMGFIGSEVAASLRQCGVDVVAIEPSATPLFRVLGGEVGQVLGAVHRDRGVETVFEDSVAAFEGTTRVERIVTKRGRRIDCDFAVVGVGIDPVTDLGATAGVRLENGIVVDEYCRTNRDGVYAAGDVANHFHPIFGRHIRVEHWQHALKQGAAAARSMLGRREPYDEIHWFWSDQYDANLQYAGFHTTWDQLVIRGSLGERRFVGFYLRDGRVDAVLAFNRGTDVRRAIPLIKSRLQVDPARLRDETVDLRTLVAPAGADPLPPR